MSRRSNRLWAGAGLLVVVLMLTLAKMTLSTADDAELNAKAMRIAFTSAPIHQISGSSPSPDLPWSEGTKRTLLLFSPARAPAPDALALLMAKHRSGKSLAIGFPSESTLKEAFGPNVAIVYFGADYLEESEVTFLSGSGRRFERSDSPELGGRIIREADVDLGKVPLQDPSAISGAIHLSLRPIEEMADSDPYVLYGNSIEEVRRFAVNRAASGRL